MGDEKENRDEKFLEAQAHIWNHTFKYMNSMSLKCIIELGIPDIIHNHGQPMSLFQLIEALHIHPSKAQSLARLMRLLVHSGFFSQTQHQDVIKYGLTPSSRYLLRPNTTTQTLETLPFLFLALHEAMMSPCESLSRWLRSAAEDGHSAFEMVNGKSMWKCIGDETEFGNLFYQTMAYDSQLIGRLIRRGECREVFEGVKSMVDVGGGQAIMAKAIVEAFPHIACNVIDLPYKTTKDSNLIGVGEGNYLFQPIQIPPTDAVLLKSVLHQCNDEECISILKNCKDAIIKSGEGGKVIIIEAVLEMENQMEDKESTETLLCGDVLMMATFNTKKRNEKEWKTLFLAAGFNHYNIISFLGIRSLIQIYP